MRNVKDFKVSTYQLRLQFKPTAVTIRLLGTRYDQEGEFHVSVSALYKMD